MSTEVYDLLILGAGPAGLSAAVEAQRGGLARIRVLEKGPSHSQMIRTYYKEGKRVDARYAGQEAICFGLLCLRDGNRESYLGLMDHVIESHGISIDYNTEVWALNREKDHFLLKSSRGDYAAKTVVLAIGRMGRPRQPDYVNTIPAALKNNGAIRYDITSGEVRGPRVLVVGGGDSAAEYCDILSRTHEVTLSYRGKEWSKMNPTNRAILEKLVQEGHIQNRQPSNIASITDENGRARVRFQEAEFTEESFDTVLYALGGMTPVAFLKNAQVPLGENGEALVNAQHETQLPGLYIVGDLLGKGRGGGSIIAGFNSAAEAVRNLLAQYFNVHLEPEFVELDHLKY